MKIAIGADHAGFELKEKLREFLQEEDYEIIDVGPTAFQPGDDYPIYAAQVGRLVSTGEVDRGILVCDSGIGVDIVANRFPGVRSALVHDEEMAKITRQHNDSNVLSLGAMIVDPDKAQRIVTNWLETEFTHAERHQRRIEEIEELDRQCVGGEP